jgi:hypothetical protein
VSSFWISTSTGGAFDIGDPQPDMVNFMDLAYALVQVPRFTGHTAPLVYYPVSQHSVECFHAAVRSGFGYELCRQAFAHDMHEAYTGDWNTILKNLVEDKLGVSIRDQIEGPIATAVRAAFGLPKGLSEKVKLVDARMLMTERRDLLIPHNNPKFWWPDVEPYEWTVASPNTHNEALHRFIGVAQMIGFC